MIPQPSDLPEWPAAIESIRAQKPLDEEGNEQPPAGTLAELKWYRETLASEHAAAKFDYSGDDDEEAEKAVDDLRLRRIGMERCSDMLKELMLAVMSVSGGRSDLGPDIPPDQRQRQVSSQREVAQVHAVQISRACPN